MVVPRQVISDRLPCLADGLIGFKYISSYFTLRHSRSIKTLSRQLPLPSIDRAIPRERTASVKTVLVN
ncbi:hypothetical protein AWB81_08076 [Caballeronia arationis]|nr:hypothetical protein AWB81_08076 [Caballeronia arationis]